MLLVTTIYLSVAKAPLSLRGPAQPWCRRPCAKPQNPRELTQLRRFEHFKVPKWLRLLRPTPKGRHYSGIGGTGPAVILGGGWAGSSSLSFFSNRLSSGSGSV